MSNIIIRRGSFVCTLYDVGNFMELPLANIRKLWKIMFDAEDENGETIDAIRAWLPQVVAAKTDSAKTLAAELSSAKQDAEATRRIMAGMGTALMERITITKRELARAKKKKLPAEQLAKYQEAFDRAMRPKADHQLAEKKVVWLDTALKTAIAAHAKAQKLQVIFDQNSRR